MPSTPLPAGSRNNANDPPEHKPEPETFGEPLPVDLEPDDSLPLTQQPAPADERPSENLPDTQ